MPSSLTSRYSLVPGRSVPCSRRMWYWSGVSCSRHSASVLVVFGVVIWLRSGSRELAWRRRVPLGHWVSVVRIGGGRGIGLADRRVQGRMWIAIRVLHPRPVLRLERAVGVLLRVVGPLVGRRFAFVPVSSIRCHVPILPLDVTSPLPAYRYAMPSAIIVGAGVFGSSLARQLATGGWEVTLVE